MPKSMTGYGRSEIKTGQFELATECRSFNNRFLDISLKLPRVLADYEYEVKARIKNMIERGKVTMTINFKDLSLTNGAFTINGERLGYYLKILNGIKTQAGISDRVTLDHLLSFKELIEPEESLIRNEQVGEALLKNIEDALNQLNAMRSEEGENIARELKKQISQLNQSVDSIYEKGQAVPREELNKLRNRISSLLDVKDVNQARLEQELALIADRVDVTEECLRIRSHIKLFLMELNGSSSLGKKLTFILQEMHREANTIGAKTTNVDIAHEVIKIKEEVEKVREQVQNLE